MSVPVTVASPWSLRVLWLSIGVLLGVALTLAGVQLGTIPASNNDHNFAIICHAVGGKVYGAGHDVCIDPSGQVIYVDNS